VNLKAKFGRRTFELRNSARKQCVHWYARRHKKKRAASVVKDIDRPLRDVSACWRPSCVSWWKTNALRGWTMNWRKD
jgi:hypothetical protein